MLALLPVSVFALLFLARLDHSSSPREPGRDMRGVFLQTAILWGAMVLLITEGLGAVHRLDRAAVALSWLGAGGLVFMFRRRLGDPSAGGRILAEAARVTSIRGGMVVLLGLVAITAPPNTVDSLLYHMARVLHWEQNSSLRHYATAFDGWLRLGRSRLRLGWQC